jgi:hypothetical protein
MRPDCRLLCAFVLMPVMWTLVPRPSVASTYSASCERFEIDGNEFGPADGTLDFVDEFDNGTLAPEWLALLGASTETGGAAVMHNPGFVTTLGPSTLEITTIENELHGVSSGSGDCTANSYWPTLPGLDSEFHMQLYSISPIIEAAGLTVNNNAGTYSVGATVTHGFGPGFSTIESHTAPLNPASVTGRIVLRFSLNDATHMLTCSYSVDGGSTFQTPFPPMHIFNVGVIDYDILLGDAGFVSPPPPPSSQVLPLASFLVANPRGPTARRVGYSVRVPHYGGFVNFGNPRSQGAVLGVKLDGTNQCFVLPPGGFWTARPRGGWTYRDRQGVNGPVQQAMVQFSSRGTLASRATILGKHGAVNLVPPGSVGGVRLALVGGAGYCASTANGRVRSNTTKRFRVTNAPPPSSCNVSCSPSGAFLDGLDVVS